MPGKLSVCLIVRDEADVLPRCLASIAGLADELIAVDTGSTDGSQDILRQAGATVIEMPWQEDFGIARSQAIRYVTGDWVLFIDADEAVDETTRSHIRLLMVDLDTPVSFEVPILSYLEDDETGETTLSWMPRLFNKPAEHFYYGRLHEQLIGSRPVRLDTNVFSLRHWGYQPSRTAAKGKAARNEAMLAADETDPLRTCLYAAAAATAPQDVLTHALQALEHMVPSTPPAVVVTIANMIIKSYNRLEQFDVALADGAVLLERFATLDTEAQYWLLIGDAHRGKGDDAGTEAAYQRAFDLIGENRVLQSYWNELVPANAAMGLAAMMVRRGAQDEARAVLERAIRLDRLSQKAAAKLKGALASTYAGTGLVAEAWDSAQEALATLPELRTSLANSFIDHNEPLLAMRIMAPALDPLILRDRVMTMAASLLGDRRAIDLLEWLLADYGEDGPTRVNMGLHWLSLNEADLARETIAAGLGESPSAGIVEIRMAYFEQVLGRPEAAEARLAATVQAAIEAGAEDWLAEALVQWGNLAFQMSQWDKAADLLTEALARRPQDPYVHYALASSRYGQGDLIAAREGYERALLIDPTFAPAHQGLDVLNRLAGTSSIS